MKKNIIVTGATRSGTTWTGSIFRSAPELRGVNEPFNLHTNPEVNPFHYWFEYVHEGCSSRYLENVASYIKNKVGVGRVCVKDPIAIMSIEWLSKLINADVIFCIRHPAAFAGSLKVKNWKHPFKHFKAQRELMDLLPNVLCDQICAYSRANHDIVDQAILLWNVIYSRVLDFRELNREGWHFVRHEDLSMAPNKLFRILFEKLDISFCDSIVHQLKLTTTGQQHTRLRRDSIANIQTWKSRLTPEEITRVSLGTKSLYRRFYPDHADFG